MALLPLLAAAGGLGRALAFPLQPVARTQLLGPLPSHGRRRRVAAKMHTLLVVAALQGWPTEQQLLALMRTRPGEAVAYQVCTKAPKTANIGAACTVIRAAALPDTCITCYEQSWQASQLLFTMYSIAYS